MWIPAFVKTSAGYPPKADKKTTDPSAIRNGVIKVAFNHSDNAGVSGFYPFLRPPPRRRGSSLPFPLHVIPGLLARQSLGDGRDPESIQKEFPLPIHLKLIER